MKKTTSGEKVCAVIMSGGKGTRLWPVSSQEVPKCLVEFKQDRSTLSDILKRIKGIADIRNTLFVFERSKKKVFTKRIKGVNDKNFIVEPFGRSTASAIALAAVNADPESIMVVLSADSYIDNKNGFSKTVKEAIRFVKKNNKAMFCVGIKPDSPQTGYGYIKTGRSLGGGVTKVVKFTEKPTLKKAKVLIKNKSYMWNAGIFIFKAKTILNEIEHHAPILFKNIMAFKNNEITLLKAYQKMENVSIDYQVLEKSKNLYCIRAGFKCADIGKWNNVEEMFTKGDNGNILTGAASAVDCENSAVYNFTDKKIGIVGLKDIVVVNTEKGTLVCSKAAAEKVKELKFT